MKMRGVGGPANMKMNFVGRSIPSFLYSSCIIVLTSDVVGMYDDGLN